MLLTLGGWGEEELSTSNSDLSCPLVQTFFHILCKIVTAKITKHAAEEMRFLCVCRWTSFRWISSATALLLFFPSPSAQRCYIPIFIYVSCMSIVFSFYFYLFIYFLSPPDSQKKRESQIPIQGITAPKRGGRTPGSQHAPRGNFGPLLPSACTVTCIAFEFKSRHLSTYFCLKDLMGSYTIPFSE